MLDIKNFFTVARDHGVVVPTERDRLWTVRNAAVKKIDLSNRVHLKNENKSGIEINDDIMDKITTEFGDPFRSIMAGDEDSGHLILIRDGKHAGKFGVIFDKDELTENLECIVHVLDEGEVVKEDVTKVEFKKDEGAGQTTCLRYDALAYYKTIHLT